MSASQYEVLRSNFYLPDDFTNSVRVMMFVDGENLAIRYGNIKGNDERLTHVDYQNGVYAWSKYGNIKRHAQACVIRIYYYTSAQGDEKRLLQLEDQLKDIGIEAPRVFKKIKSRGSKRVDISLATDMLTHAHRKNYDLAILVAGDEDYLPLVEAVKMEGCRVVLWFFTEGLSPALKRSSDYFYDIGNFFFRDDISKYMVA